MVFILWLVCCGDDFWVLFCNVSSGFILVQAYQAKREDLYLTFWVPPVHTRRPLMNLRKITAHSLPPLNRRPLKHFSRSLWYADQESYFTLKCSGSTLDIISFSEFHFVTAFFAVG